MTIVGVDPATGSVRSEHTLDLQQGVETILEQAVIAQAEWEQRPIASRVGVLAEVARLLRADDGRYARTITAEMGKPITEAESEVEKCAITLDYYAENAERFLADESIATDHADSRIVCDPLGVVLAIMPWNYPFWQFFRFAAPALAAGNAAVLKHASNVPDSARLIEEVLRAAGAPTGLCQVLMIESADVADVIADARIAALTLTGSTEVGSIVAAQAGAALKKQVLELGGSDPFVVLADADVEAAAAAAVTARFLNNGQSCVNAKRFIVVDSVADRFVTAFADNVRALRLGDPQDRETRIGPMARDDLREEIDRQVRQTVAAGATLVCGGAVVPGPGFYYEPTVLDHVAPSHIAFRQETFGPVAAVTRARDADEAIRLANETDFGLGASLWTRDLKTARHVARVLRAGAVFVNAIVASDPRMPFGGIKKSGYGRELGESGIKEFVNLKTVCLNP